MNSGHILAGSLGYYLNPLANVLLGRFVLKERLSGCNGPRSRSRQPAFPRWPGALGQLWISLTLCVSFATYGLLRKIAPVDAVAGLAIETGCCFPLAAGWLVWGIRGRRPDLRRIAARLLADCGRRPRDRDAAAALHRRARLRYSTLGMLQFLAPTLQFLFAVLLYGEPFTRAHAIAFGAIWTALALYIVALVRHARASVTVPE